MHNSIAGLFAVTTSVAVTLLSGAVYGHISQRWGSPEVADAAGELMADFPDDIGEWRLQSEDALDDRSQGLLRCHGQLHRNYTNRRTGATIDFYLVLGPAGPISVHQPEICFKSQAYSQRSSRELSSIADGDSFWSLTFDPSSTNIHGAVTRVYYGWSDGSVWTASKDARFEFAGRPYLYKLQVSAQLPLSSDIGTYDPCLDFLNAALPACHACMRAPD